MQEIRFPVGRYVGGNLYRSQPVTDDAGKPVLDERGVQKVKFSVAVAFEKAGTTHWAQTPWGAIVWAEGHAGYPNGEGQRPDFAWKIIDGDSAIPNRRGNKPVDNAGWPGHWVVWFGGSFAPRTCNANGTVEYRDAEERIKHGHFVEMFGSVKDNKPSKSPGVYMNYLVVAHAGFGPEIAVGSAVDVTKVGFGAAALPAGASAVPLGMQAAPGVAVPTGAPAVPGAPMPGPAAYTPVPATPAAPIVPNPAFLAPPAVAPVAAVPVAMPTAAVPVPAMPVPVPAASISRMTAKAAGHTYEAMRGAGWTDEALILQGYMTA